LGNPFNVAKDGQASASWGILSNFARRYEKPVTEKPVNGLFRYDPTLLQLDSKLNLGMSGGAVVNLKGELIGITTAAGSPSGFDAQAGYAIPMDALGLRAVEALKQGKEVEYAFIGVGLDPNDSSRISDVKAGTPAAQGRLLVGDKIIDVNGTKVVGEAGLSLTLATAPVGAPIRLKVQRQGQIIETSVNTSKYPLHAADVIATNRTKPWRGVRVDFSSMLVRNGPQSQDNLAAMAKGGVSVVDVETGSVADLAGIKKGQLITSVAGNKVATPAEFARVVADLKGPTQVEIDLRKVTVP
jgi:serine protease Do